MAEEEESSSSVISIIIMSEKCRHSSVDHCSLLLLTSDIKTKMMSVTLWWFLFLSTSALIVSGLNRVDFSASLQQAVNDMIGSDKFKVTAQSVVVSSLIKQRS